jgi:hypothetical protein
VIRLYHPPGVVWRRLAGLFLGYSGRELLWIINFNCYLDDFFLTDADGLTVTRGSFLHCIGVAEHAEAA